jgi:hypothetical protein
VSQRHLALIQKALYKKYEEFFLFSEKEKGCIFVKTKSLR